MPRYLYASLLVVSSAILSFLIAVVLGVYILSGEAARGAGVYWALSSPATVIAAIVIGILAFPWYRTRESLGGQIFVLLVCTAAASAMGLAVTALGFDVYVAIVG